MAYPEFNFGSEFSKNSAKEITVNKITNPSGEIVTITGEVLGMFDEQFQRSLEGKLVVDPTRHPGKVFEVVSITPTERISAIKLPDGRIRNPTFTVTLRVFPEAQIGQTYTTNVRFYDDEFPYSPGEIRIRINTALAPSDNDLLNAKAILPRTISGQVTQTGGEPPKTILIARDKEVCRINNLTIFSDSNVGSFDMKVYHNATPIAFIDGRIPKLASASSLDRTVKYNILNKNEQVYLQPGQSISLDPEGTYGGTATIFYVCSYDLIQF